MPNTLALNVRIASLKSVADDIVSLELVPMEGAYLPSFSAGSHIDVEVKPSVVRQYSLFNSPTETKRYCIAVLLEPSSRGGSIAVHHDLKVGDTIRISEPRNFFQLFQSSGKTFLLAGGIGITPIYSMAHELSRRMAPFEFHYCTRSRSRTAFYDDLSAETWRGSLSIHFDDGPDAQKLSLAFLEKRNSNDHLYVCGPKGFIEYVLKSAEQAGWPAGNVHREYFSSDIAHSGPQDAFSVRIASTGATYEIPDGKTVVDVLRTKGIDIPTSCSEGICGTCITKVLEGVPLHKDMVLTDEEHGRNDRFTPCCSRSKTPLLVLDL